MSHFQDKEALQHVIEKRAEGIVSLSESHGTELPGALSAGADSARETSIVLLFMWLLFQFQEISSSSQLIILLSFGIGWLLWKTGRSAWLGWSRLERLHRVIEQEKEEIEQNRATEREELGALYRAKGFQGKLLEDVLDVLMADQDRLLKVMLEEELGLTLQAYEHPLKQCVGAAIGVLCALLFSGCLFYLLPHYGLPIASFCTIVSAATLSAYHEKNHLLSAFVWNFSIASVGFGTMYFIFQFLNELMSR